MRIRCRNSGEPQGMAVIALIALLAIILIFVAGNLRTVDLLRRDLRLIEWQQTNRLAHIVVLRTNLPSVGVAVTNVSEPKRAANNSSN